MAGPAFLTAALLGVVALATAGAGVSIVASVTWLAIERSPAVGEPAIVGLAVTATAGAILTVLAFANGLGART